MSTANGSSSSKDDNSSCPDISKYLSVLLDEESSEDDDSNETKCNDITKNDSSTTKESDETFQVLNNPNIDDSESSELEELSVLNDIVDVNPEFILTTILFNQVQPKKVICSSSASIKFISVLKTLVNGELSPGHDLADQKKLILLPGKEYAYDACRRQILSLKLPGAHCDMNPEEQRWHVQSKFDLQSESMVLALGMLLKCLEKSFVHLNLEAGDNKAPINSITDINLENLVNMDTETFRALKIFNQISHPSNFMKGLVSSNKEGLSIFGIFNRCKTVAGSKFMRVMLLQPSHDLEVLNNRLDVVEFSYNPRNDEIIKCMGDHLKSIKSINKIMSRLMAARASINEWKTLHKTIYHCISLGELCRRASSQAKLFEEISLCNTETMYHIIHCIDSIIDFTESERLNKFSVKSGLDEELDQKKYKYSKLHEVMSNLAKSELGTLPPHVQECSVVYIPEIGYLLAITEWKTNVSEDEALIPGLDLMFSAGSTLYYKSAKTRELDSRIGDCVVEISEHESRIMVQLVQFLQEHVSHLQHMIALSAQLDCLISLGTVARENNYVRPVLTDTRIINIQNGRHPLQELCVNDFVPNDTFSGGKQDTHGLMKILTGPNACGKSVYLKQIALIIYLAHIGSFVPATSATIGLVDHIHTRIQTVESVATQISAFAIDVKQMILCLYSSTPNSLIIVDEFGKGTSEGSGLALLAACLQHFLSRGSKCPHVFISTHFHRIINMLPNSPLCSFQTLEYMMDDNDQIVYLYKLKDGNVTSSLAVKVLQSLSIEEKNVKKASEFLEAMSSDKLITRDLASRRAIQINMRREIASKFLSSAFSAEELQKLTCLLEKFKEKWG
ncbi:DNA mismatch repair protein spellchecker 1 [Gryllus bimaculatus]|nr:DNA mismatch repair protein spellchecker 1 [Gryllus bimaculatus]